MKDVLCYVQYAHIYERVLMTEKYSNSNDVCIA